MQTTSIIATLHTAGQIAREAVETHTGLTHTRAIILQALARNNGASQTTLTQLTGIDRSTLADTMRRLLRDGYVARKRTRADARRYAVTLTETGSRALAKIEAAEAAIFADITARIPAAAKLRIKPLPPEVHT